MDGVTWEDYEVEAELRLASLHDRVHGGSYRPQVTTHGVRSLSERRQAPMVPSTVLKVPAPEVRRAVATTVRTAASPLADHMAR